MTDDLKERLQRRAIHNRGTWDGGTLEKDALARITELENTLVDLAATLNATAAAQVADLEASLAAAEAGEDALAEALRHILPAEYIDFELRDNALAAYEARRKG